MKIGRKVFINALASLVIGAVVSIIIAGNVFGNYIQNEEEKSVQKNYENTSLLLNSEEDILERTQLDWANWDETYEYIQKEDDNYIKENLGEITLEQLNLYGMIFMDKNLNCIHSEISSKSNSQDISNEIINQLQKSSMLQNMNLNNISSGITVINNKFFVISGAGITTTDGKAEPNGYLIMIRELDDTFIAYMEKLLDTKIKIEIDDTDADKKEFSYDKFHLIDIKRSHDILENRAAIKNILDDKGIIFHTEIERTSYKKGVETFNICVCILMLIFMATIASCLIVINNVVIKRVLKLGKFVDEIIETNDVSLKIDVSGKDEISKFSNNINNMLEKLYNNYTEIKKNDEMLHLIMEATSDGYFDYDVKNKRINLSLSWIKHLGFNTESSQMNYNEVFEHIFEEDIIKLKEMIQDYLSNGKINFSAEVRVYKANKGYIWSLIRGKVVNYDKNGQQLRWIGTVSDITERKAAEMQNVYLLQTDPITNLKNRAYMENILNDLAEDKNEDYCILMADVNGLKLMNDAFGHKEGDRLLSVVGDIFRISCDNTDIPVRWGGDEFLILIKNNKTYADKLLQKIKAECILIDTFPIKLNLAMGCAAKNEGDSLTEEVIRIAEERMYQNKLLESRSVRNAVIASLKQTLIERQVENKGHTERVKEICLNIGRKLKLTQDEFDELQLLSYLHDIGKIAIPESILLKEEELTEEEKAIMKTHTEIGCRIARSIPDLANISDKILTHHEYYDGSGYPRGLSKQNIPKTSRILAIADRFDIMTHGTIYKKPISVDEALKEIEKNSGLRFDPEIVKVFLDSYHQM